MDLQSYKTDKSSHLRSRINTGYMNVFSDYTVSFATSGLTASVGVGGQTAGRSISTTHATHVPHFPGVQHAIAAKQLIGDKQHI